MSKKGPFLFCLFLANHSGLNSCLFLLFLEKKRRKESRFCNIFFFFSNPFFFFSSPDRHRRGRLPLPPLQAERGPALLRVQGEIYAQQGTHGQGEGYGGGDAHGLTPQNTVPLPKAKFDPPNREKMKIFVATPSLFHKTRRKITIFFTFLNFGKKFFFEVLAAEENISFYPLPTHTLNFKNSPPPYVTFCSPPP